MRPTSNGWSLKRNHTARYPTPITISPKYCINFRFAVHIMADGKFSGTFRTFRNLCVIRNVVSGPNCEFQAGVQIEEGNGAMLKFSPNNPLRRQAKPVAIESERLF